MDTELCNEDLTRKLLLLQSVVNEYIETIDEVKRLRQAVAEYEGGCDAAGLSEIAES